MKMFVIEDNSVTKVFDDFSKEKYFTNNVSLFSSLEEAQDFLKDNGYEASEKLQAIVFADGCDCCKEYFTAPAWGWESKDAEELTKNDYEYFDKIIHAYDNNIKVTDWCPGTTIDGDTLNFCEDCYSNKKDKELGIVDEGICVLYTSITNSISDGLRPILQDLPSFNNNISFLNYNIKKYFLDNIAYNDNKIILTSDEINPFIENVLNCNESNTNIPYETEKAISNVITNAFKDNGFTVDFDFDKSKKNELMSFADYKHLVFAFTNIYQDHVPYEKTTRGLNSVLHETPDYRLTHSKDGLVLSSKHNSSSKKLSVAEFASFNKYQFENFVKDFIQTSKDSSKVTFNTKNLISSSINNTINLLKSQGVSLPEIGKALNEATKEQLVLLGKENMANKGR